MKLAAVAVTAAVLSGVLRKNTPELALLLALAAGLWMLALAAGALGAAVALMEELAARAGLTDVLLEPVLKVVALSLSIAALACAVVAYWDRLAQLCCKTRQSISRGCHASEYEDYEEE